MLILELACALPIVQRDFMALILFVTKINVLHQLHQNMQMILLTFVLPNVLKEHMENLIPENV
jgi:hypothetical protein